MTMSPSSYPIFPQGFGHGNHLLPRGAGTSSGAGAVVVNCAINGGRGCGRFCVSDAKAGDGVIECLLLITLADVG